MKETGAGYRTGGEGDKACHGASKPPALRRSVPAVELFGDRREVFIEHSGEIYTLRLTRKGKLILNK